MTPRLVRMWGCCIAPRQVRAGGEFSAGARDWEAPDLGVLLGVR